MVDELLEAHGTGLALRLSVGVVCALIALACQSSLSAVGGLRLPGGSAPRITEEELHEEVSAAAMRFASSLSSAADAIGETAPDRVVRRRALLWKINTVPLAQRAAQLPHAAEGLLALVQLTTSQRRYLVDGAGSQLFVDQQELARRTAIELDEDVRELVRRLLGPDEAARLIAQVDQVAQQHPIQGQFTFGATLRGLTQLAYAGGFDWFLRAPMAPFRALEGVESGAQAVHGLNETARQFGQVVATLPSNTRWELELLLLDVEESESVTTALTALESLAESAERFSLGAEELPHAVSRELQAVLEGAREDQQELRRTFRSLYDVIDAADGAFASAYPVIQSLERATGHADDAGRSWATVLAALRNPDREQKSEQRHVEGQGHPFDVRDYEQAAARIQATTQEIRGLLADLDESRDSSLPILDGVLWRALALVGGWFLLLLAYRILVAHFAVRHPYDGGRPARTSPAGV